METLQDNETHTQFWVRKVRNDIIEECAQEVLRVYQDGKDIANTIRNLKDMR